VNSSASIANRTWSRHRLPIFRYRGEYPSRRNPTLDERDRTRVVGLDVGLDAVQSQRAERVSQHQAETFEHVPPALMRDERRVPEVRAPQVAEHHVTEARAADERVVLVAADEVGLAERSQEHVPEALGGLGEVGPRAMQLPARAHRPDEAGFVAGLQATDGDVVTALERLEPHQRNGTR